jgi:hypothetical protein
MLYQQALAFLRKLAVTGKKAFFSVTGSKKRNANT